MRNYILQIDTATEICSVSLSSNGENILEIIAEESNVHASMLTIYIEELLRTSGVGFDQLAAVCISKGPGSYTGLRIGTSTAKGLCYALDIPLLAINTLDIMFLGIDCENEADAEIYVPMLDARRMEVYMKAFDTSGTVLLDTEARIIEASSFNEFGPKNTMLFGPGATKLETLFTDHPFIHVKMDFAYRSSHMSTLAYEKYCSNEFERLIYFEPFYLKDFITTSPKSKL